MLLCMEHNTPRYQRGYIYKAFGAWHVRYRVMEDGTRKQQSHRLCDGGRSKGEALRLCNEFMLTVNATRPDLAPEETPIAAFWANTYWPFVLKNCKPSTQLGYQQVWNQHLKPHFGSMTLREYRKGMGSVFLTGLAEHYSKRTVQHIKNLASGVFTHAANLDLIELNPWHHCKVLGKMADPEPTEHYTLEEIENIITALIDHVDCQLIMALCFFVGLRKGEVQGLQWSDFDPEWVHIRRSVVRGLITTPKTKKSIRTLPLEWPVTDLLKAWRVKSGRCDGWVFVTERGNPISLKDTSAHVIRPALAKAGLQWKGFHAGRRGHGTALRQITGDSTAGRDSLGHEDERITQDAYEKKSLEGLRVAFKQLGEKTLNRGGKQ